MGHDGGAQDDQDEGQTTGGALPSWHPSLFISVFRAGLEISAETKKLEEAFVTPQSAGTWGDFARARTIFASGLTADADPTWGHNAPDVAYVRLVEADHRAVDDLTGAPATMHATLVWRPELALVPGNSWRIHHLGEQVDLALIPRTAPGVDPRTPL